jgi:hypothetical protein
MQGCAVRWPGIGPRDLSGACCWCTRPSRLLARHLGPLTILGGAFYIMRRSYFGRNSHAQPDGTTRSARSAFVSNNGGRIPKYPTTWTREADKQLVPSLPALSSLLLRAI